MPVTAIAAGASGLLSAGTGIAQAMSSGKEIKRYQKIIENYKRQKLVNPNEGLQISTLGADRKREDLARTSATLATNAALGGSRSVVGLAGNIIQSQNTQEAQILAELDQQEAQRQQLIAQGAFGVQQMEEQREKDDLLGLGQGLAAANQSKANGWNTFGQGMMSLGMGAASGVFDGIGKGKKGKDGIAERPTFGKKTEWRSGTAEYIPLDFSKTQANNFNGNRQFRAPSWMLN